MLTAFSCRKRFHRTAAVLSLLAMSGVPAFASASPEVKGNPEELRRFLHPQKRLVSLNAEDEQKVYADIANVSLVVTTEESTMASALERNSKVRQTLIAALLSSGVKRDSINTSKFSTSPQYGWFGKKPTSYKVLNRMAVSITNEAQLHALAKLADSNKEVEFSETEFEYSQEDTLKKTLKARALKKIMEEKSFYEKSLGVSLKPVIFHDANVFQQATAGARALEEVAVMSAQDDYSGVKSKLRGAPSQPRAGSFDEMVFRARLVVEFEVVAKD